MPETAPFGAWKSPITSDRIVAESIRLTDVALDGDDIYWLEGRPAEKGRSVLVRRSPDGATQDVTPAPFNVRTRVHEYGGGAFLVSGSTVYFSNDPDGRLYRQSVGNEPQALTPEGPFRYADIVLDAQRKRLLCIREDHSAEGEPRNEIVAVALDKGTVTPLVSGADFYSNPRVSPDGKTLAWIEWNHPNMPWDATSLYTAPLSTKVGKPKKIAGGKDESVIQPEWSPGGALYFLSDRNGWWNLHRAGASGKPECVLAKQAEFGYPPWVFGWRTYALASDETAFCAYHTPDGWNLGKLDLKGKKLSPIRCPYKDISHLAADAERLLFLGGAPDSPDAVALRKGTKLLELQTSSPPDPDLQRYVSVPEAIEFPTDAHPPDDLAHAFYYPPFNPDFQAPDDERPPLIVISHGGPTAQASPALDWRKQYWTSRGFAVVDVNYGGSSGFGRAYRERLAGQWGLVDVDDCCNVARHLVSEDRADPDRLIIRGGSAGGYTTLAALAMRGVFDAGASYYGVSDLAALAKDTHKFESRYLDKLVGPYPEKEDIYQERSPIYHADGLNAPVIFFQGSEDKVVPLEQAEKMVEALRAKGLLVGYLLFDGEQHGFRQAENIKRALDAELYFYASIFLKKGLRF
ncbi:MAG: S9 family peptidase [Acidobacteria bacterium]|nr:S9 family peptidase [Acidobacteriota bacterium]